MRGGEAELTDERSCSHGLLRLDCPGVMRFRRRSSLNRSAPRIHDRHIMPVVSPDSSTDRKGKQHRSPGRARPGSPNPCALIDAAVGNSLARVNARIQARSAKTFDQPNRNPWHGSLDFPCSRVKVCPCNHPPPFITHSLLVQITAAQIAAQIEGEVQGDGTVEITGLAPADCAKPGDLTFAENPIHLAAAERGPATAILVSGAFPPSSKVVIRVPNARIALAKLLPILFPPDLPASGIHPSAVVDTTAQIDATAHIGPHCVVGARVRLGARSVLMGGNHLDRDCQVGNDVRLFPNVVVYAHSHIGDRVTVHAGTVIGSDGYGYVLDEGRHRKMLQVGGVTIQDDVEIGANAAIDRGAIHSTLIGQGTKIDNLVHIAHNVVLGKHCLIMGQVGFAGSTRLGDYCVVASQSGIADHLRLGNRSTVGAKSGVMRDIPEDGTVLGIPAVPHQQAKRQWIALQRLPEWLVRQRKLEQEVEQLRTRLADAGA